MASESQITLTDQMMRRHLAQAEIRERKWQEQGVPLKVRKIAVSQEMAIALGMIEAAACKRRDEEFHRFNRRVTVADFHDALRANSTEEQRGNGD